MENFTLRQALQACGGVYKGPDAVLETSLQDIATDSRNVSGNSLFVAIPGERVNGHDFISAAAQKGAIAALVQEDTDSTLPCIRVPDTIAALGDIARAYRRQFTGILIGVTGSVGKTTCKDMLASVLGQKYTVLKTAGNFNNHLGVPLTLLQINSSHQVAVIEMGINHFGEMSYLASIAQPNLAVFTNAADAHLENLGDRAGVVRAKTEMCGFLRPGASIFLNGDDEYFRYYQPPFNIKRYRYGSTADCDVRVLSWDNTANGFCCTVEGLGLSALELHSRYRGTHLLYSILPAVAVARQMGLNEEQIRDGVAAFAPPSGRGNILSTTSLQIMDSTYNANPTSMQAALDDLAGMTGRRVAILGDMYELGSNAEQLHRQVGEYARGKADVLLSVGDLAAVMQADAHFDTPQQLIAALPSLLRKGDSVLVKSSHSLHLETVVQALQALELH